LVSSASFSAVVSSRSTSRSNAIGRERKSLHSRMRLIALARPRLALDEVDMYRHHMPFAARTPAAGRPSV
jgi:hypothetical protein